MRAKSLVAVVVLSSLALVACGSRAGSSGSTASNAPTSASNNTASDTGVTPAEIKVGSIAGLSSTFGPDTFSASLYGARAYFQAVNAAGGVNGRKINFVECDDKGSGDENVNCAHKLVDDQKVFALAGVTSFVYSGAQYINSKGVPDIGGQPIDNSYDQYPHLYSIYGSYYPRDGGRPGYNGTLYAGTETDRWFKENLHSNVAGVVYYNVAQSQRYANSIINGLQKEGYTVVKEEINLGAPAWDSAVLDLKRRGVQLVFDAMDDGGNAQLCNSIESQKMPLQAKVATAQGMANNIDQIYSASPTCRNLIYSTNGSANYSDTSIPAVAQYQKDLQAAAPDRVAKENLWMMEGYTSAEWLTDAIRSCGADVTRKCVEAFMNNGKGYSAGGLLIPTNRVFVHAPTPPTHERNCLNVTRWQDSANGGKGGWVSQVKDMNTNCFDVPNLPYSAG
ncbi:ABC-type branched-chain amino acid transport system, periplasmic component [Frankia sp. AiPs1]|uniref:ABC transporter substrate-binding protein n=1 Tax=Frankia sp. AiPa1 TaxID=573492 RepID=UPI00202AC61B|nr:ABC transporter substrate-binding protein [Frankia sp. AiPa1]MCL9762439.1 ABC transporter substrate-binding protein [Frankia sp. AiPa1]